MTLKTPEQVAADRIAQLDISDSLTGALQSGWFDGNDVERWIAEAIKTDRAQRAEIHQDWRDDQENVRDAGSVEVTWYVHDANGRMTFQSDMTLTAEQAVGMFQGIGEVSA